MDWADEIEEMKRMSDEDYKKYRDIRFGGLAGTIVKLMLIIGAIALGYLVFC